MADPSTLPLPVTEETTKLDGKNEAEGITLDDKNESFMEQKAFRADKVKNAVNFLSHPSVRGSPIVHRRSFLESKGLSKDEIEEAFRQVPDPPSNNFPGAVAATEGKLFIEEQKKSTSPVSSGAVISTQQTTPQLPLPAVSSVVEPHSIYSWSHMVLALGFLVAAGTGVQFLFKRYFLPKMKSWICHVILEDAAPATVMPKVRNPGDEVAMATAVAAKAVSNAAAQITGASQEMIKMGNKERYYLGSVVQALEVHTHELTKAVIAMKMAMEAVAYSNGKWGSQQSKSMEGIETTQEKLMAMQDGVEKHLVLREHIGISSNSDQPPSISRLQHRAKPWEMVKIDSGNGLSQAYTSEVTSENIADSVLASNSWRQGNELPPTQQNYSLSISDPGSVAPWWRQRKAEPKLHSGHKWSPDSTAKSKIEVVIGNGGTALESSSPSSVSVSKDGSINISSSNSQRRLGLVPPIVPATVTAINGQMEMLKDETKSIASVLESPPISLPFEVEDKFSLLNSHAVQDSPPAAATNESGNAAIPSQLTRDNEEHSIASDSI